MDKPTNTRELSIEESLINHLSLPSQLPQHQDSGLEKIESSLLSRLEDSSICMRNLTEGTTRDVWLSVSRSLAVWRSVSAFGRLDQAALGIALRRLSSTDFIPLYIREQNAGIFIYRSSSEVTFEMFEASARSKCVLAATGAMQWDFPGSAVAIPYSTFLEEGFISSLCSFLEQASVESIKDFAARTNKAGLVITEDRDTSDPSLISSLLVALLEANGRRVTPKLLHKRVRDEVLWNKAALPWRRLPFWLVIRVAIHRHLLRRLSSSEKNFDCARVHYKFFICQLLAGLLDDIRNTTAPDRLSHLKGKLCRRLAKLDVEMETASPDALDCYRYYKDHLGKYLEQSVLQADASLRLRWDRFKESATRKILPLPRQAEPESLSLSFQAGSLQYLNHVVSRFRNSRLLFRQRSPNNLTPRSSDILDPYLKLAEAESQILQDFTPADPSSETVCLDLARTIRQYTGNVGDHYDFSVEQKSIMLLTVMELWLRLDQQICNLYPLLREFHPSFSPDILDVLHLPEWTDMKRLRHIQAYLRLRVDHCGRSSPTIFDPPREGCFAQRFFDTAPEAARLHKLLSLVKEKALEDRQAKEDEWIQKNARFESLSRQIERSSCSYLPDNSTGQNGRYIGPQSHDPKCARCGMERMVRTLRITIFEDPLPTDDLMAKVAVFELGGYPAFEAYRDVTYFIIAKFGTEKLEKAGTPPKCSIREYLQLRVFAAGEEPSFRLVSTTKSFLNTHYASVSFPAALSDVLRSNGLKFAYFDAGTGSWARRLRRPTLAHLCSLRLPCSSPLAPLINPLPVDKFGPSSYETMASQSACPTGVNTHEYLAVQSLLGGTSRRWISLLTELGSSNINFSTEAIAMVVSHVANQCGPGDEDGNVLGKNHAIFHDPQFRKALLLQMAHRLESISSNWREVFAMEIILTITLRISEKSVSEVGKDEDISSSSILARAREITLDWVRLLRAETKTATDAKTALGYQTYVLWAALLCKRTFSTTIGSFALVEESFSTLIFCSITLQDHLATSHDLSSSLKSAIIRDAKMMYALQDDIADVIQSDPQKLLSALSTVWPEVEEQHKQIADWDISTVSGCVSLTLESSGEYFREQTVMYNYLHGLLLVDGMAIGKLPSDHRTSTLLTELFGNQSLLAMPSRLSGMQYTLCITPGGYQIHVGFFDGQMVVRACKDGKIWELIPRDVFGSPRFFDLPGPIISDCFHWLDLKDGKIMEIRPKQFMWQSREQNWRLNIMTGTCTRTRVGKRELLINPHSRLFHRAARNLEGLESREHILFYQRQLYPTTKFSLFVDLPRLQLSFFTKRGLLHSPQYQAVVANDQNIGTWHGLHSMLVLMDYNTGKRMVLVPFGNLDVQRDGDHVRVKIHGRGQFGKFVVNDVLQRIECAPEPLLIYQKARLHAYTSFPVPDSLTGMTGGEAALHWLSSGMCQPWSPLGAPQMEILRSISHLTPRREFYPPDLKVMVREDWDAHLTTTIQHDAFGYVVRTLVDKSKSLSLFALGSKDKSSPQIEEIPSYGDNYLNVRSWMRRQSYHRMASFTQPPDDVSDILYNARDTDSNRKRMYSDAYEIAWILKAAPLTLRTEHSLAISLSQCQMISGYRDTIDKAEKASITDRLNVDLKREWGTLVSLAVKYRDSKYLLMFLFGPMVYRPDTNMDLARTIISFALFKELSDMKLPSFARYEHFRVHQSPDEKFLGKLAKPARLPAPYDEREDIPNLSLKMRRQLTDRRLRHEQKSEEECVALSRRLLTQWPCAKPPALKAGEFQDFLLVDTQGAIELISPEWERLYVNMEFSLHLEAVQKILSRRYSGETSLPPRCLLTEREPPALVHRGRVVPLIEELISLGTSLPVHQSKSMGYSWPPSRILTPENQNGISSAPGKGFQLPGGQSVGSPTSRTKPQTSRSSGHGHVSAAIQELARLVRPFTVSKSRIKQEYGKDLLQSVEALQAKASQGQFDAAPQNTRFEYIEPEALQKYLQFTLRQVVSSLSCPGTTEKTKWLKMGQLFPIVTPITLLEQLRSTNRVQHGSSMKSSIIQLGMTIGRVQRQLRLNDLALRGDDARYTQEAKNLGHLNWKPLEYPDWMLLEIESDMMIRAEQVDVALETISPRSSSNSVLQMNMGQGKTSVVIPMVAAVVAKKGSSLARILIPNALLQQSAQLIHSRLGGLLGREICHLPFSRKTPTDLKSLGVYMNIHRHMIQNAGVLLCLPEHSMSFQLSGMQKLIDGAIPEAQEMIQQYQWLRQVCRDVLDESDFTLAVRTQLIYPSGGQTALHGHPHRWLVAESLLAHVHSHLRGLKKSYPRSLEIVWRRGAFPLVFFLRTDVEEELLIRLTADIFHGRTEMLPVSAFDTRDRVAIKEFISNHKIRPQTLGRIKKLCPDKPHLRQTVYLLRGLLVNRILIMALKKRWNVQYGLHPAREPISVPFAAKGVPSESSEWGHPDVSILFTCLSFYYQGISIAHLKESLTHLLRSDDPAAEYDRWTSSPWFPDSLKDFHSINVEDDSQLFDVWGAVRHRVVVVNYFLNNFVFPRYAKQFKAKISSTGWDIPLLPSNNAGAKDVALTTGFSGTNDTRNMLPLTISQQDLPGLAHTNAEVLTYLLNQRNRNYVVMEGTESTRLQEEQFLHLLKSRNIRVLIDAGAAILEMDNLALVKEWLEIDTRAPAALYFDAANKPWILSRKTKSITPLLASQYAEDLHECLIYLDEAHTRGTDLKLPPNACGALTLGMGQTKDHTVQAAMRLRQLGTTQSVVFFAPPEVHHSILDFRGKLSGETVDSSDVVSWLLNNTCQSIEALQPLYYSQGIDFCRRMQAAADFPDFLKNARQREGYINLIRQEEIQSLEKLYGPRGKPKAASLKKASDPVVSGFLSELEARRKGFQDTGHAIQASALQEVEQEREVEFEVETVRQVRKASHFPAHAWPGLHKDLAVFASTGRLPAQSLCCITMMEFISRTGIGRKHFKGSSRHAAESNLLVSVEFERTVKDLATEKLNDNFIRPVNWLLWSDISSTAIVIIPEEAEAVLPIVRRAGHNKAFLLTYAAPVTRKMLLQFNSLEYYTIPSLPRGWQAPQWLKVQLGMLGGRIYFSWDEYPYLAEFYGISDHSVGEDEDTKDNDAKGPEMDGASDNLNVEHNVQKASQKSFVSNPLTFLQDWLALRRRGQDFSHTPLGFLTQGKPLQPDDPFFRKKTSEERATLRGVTARIEESKEVVEEIAYEGEIDVPVSDMDSDSEDESEISYRDDELYSNDEEDEDGQVQSSSGDDGRQAHYRGNRRRNGGGRKAYRSGQ